jgi:hypothetical protein
VSGFHHLNQNRSQLPFECEQALSKGSSGHLDSSLIRGIYLEVMSKCGMQS